MTLITSVIDRYNDASVPGIIVENKDYAGIIKKYDVVGPKIFFYFDPPYLIETRVYHHDGGCIDVLFLSDHFIFCYYGFIEKDFAEGH